MIALIICYLVKKSLIDLTIWRSETRPVPAMSKKAHQALPNGFHLGPKRQSGDRTALQGIIVQKKVVVDSFLVVYNAIVRQLSLY